MPRHLDRDDAWDDDVPDIRKRRRRDIDDDDFDDDYDDYDRPRRRRSYQNQTNGMGIAGMVLGILGLIAWLLPIVGFPVNLVGLILSSAGLNRKPQGFAIAGLVISGIGMLLTVINAIAGMILYGQRGMHW